MIYYHLLYDDTYYAHILQINHKRSVSFLSKLRNIQILLSVIIK